MKFHGYKNYQGGVKTMQEGLLCEETPRHESDIVSHIGDEAMPAMDPPRAINTSRELSNDDMLVVQEVQNTTHNERKNKNISLIHGLHEVFRKMDINIPLLELICQVPIYARFLNDLCTTKKRFKEHASMIKHKMPTKLKNPRNFTIGCQIGDTHLHGALMNLEASTVNVMFLSLY